MVLPSEALNLRFDPRLPIPIRWEGGVFDLVEGPCNGAMEDLVDHNRAGERPTDGEF